MRAKDRPRSCPGREAFDKTVSLSGHAPADGYEVKEHAPAHEHNHREQDGGDEADGGTRREAARLAPANNGENDRRGCGHDGSPPEEERGHGQHSNTQRNVVPEDATALQRDKGPFATARLDARRTKVLAVQLHFTERANEASACVAWDLRRLVWVIKTSSLPRVGDAFAGPALLRSAQQGWKYAHQKQGVAGRAAG